jgi:hypothetical protein
LLNRGSGSEPFFDGVAQHFASFVLRIRSSLVVLSATVKILESGHDDIRSLSLLHPLVSVCI